MKRLLMLITAIAVMLGGMAFAAPAAVASETTASEPVVDLSNIQYGSASFDADGSAAAKASVKTSSGVKIYLNVQVNPMTTKQIKPGTCRKAPIGKRFYNEMVDPVTGNHYFKPWRVQAGDNVFCKGRDGKWRKKSCGNLAKGIFGVPKPPTSKIRTSGHVQDYLTFTGQIGANSKLDGSATAHVVQYDDQDRKVCEAKSSISGHVWAMFSARVSVRARSMASMSTTSSRSAEASLSTNITVKGELQGKLRTHLEGEAMAWCNYTPPPPPPPPHDECPDIPGDQPEGYDCNPPPVDHKPAVNIMGSPAHLYVGGNAHVWIEASDPDGDAVSVKVSATGAGTVSGLVPVDIRWDGTPCPSGKSCFRATAWAGDTPGNMTITATVTANGLSGDPDSVTFPVKADEF